MEIEIYIEDEIKIVQPKEMPDKEFIVLLEKAEKENESNESIGFNHILYNLGIEILNIGGKVYKNPTESRAKDFKNYQKIALRTKFYHEEEPIILSKTKSDEIVFSCSLNEYSIEVKKSDEIFQELFKKNDTEIEKPLWLSDNVLSFENRWKDVIYIFNKFEKLNVTLEDINREETIWILRKIKKVTL